MEGSEGPLYPLPFPTSAIINIPHQRGTFVTISEAILIYDYHPKSIVYIRVHPWWCIFCRF